VDVWVVRAVRQLGRRNVSSGPPTILPGLCVRVLWPILAMVCYGCTLANLDALLDALWLIVVVIRQKRSKSRKLATVVCAQRSVRVNFLPYYYSGQIQPISRPQLASRWEVKVWIVAENTSDAPIWNLANIPITDNESEILADSIYNYVQIFYLSVHNFTISWPIFP